MKQTAHKGTTAKHAGTHKHTQGKGKHHPAKKKKAETHHHAQQKQHAHTAAKGHKVAKPRKLAWGDAQRGLLRLCPAPGGEAEPRQLPGASSWVNPLADVACCAAEALAWSLRLSGWPVGVADVLDLYKLTADGPDAGASILATLDAASVFGLAGVRPVSFRAVDLLARDVPAPGKLVVADVNDDLAVLGLGDGVGEQLDPLDAAQFKAFADFVPDRSVVHGLILGLELPGTHAVHQQGGQWWTWGEPYDPCCFPDAVVEEAWQVVWP